MEESAISKAINNINIKTIEYDTPYNTEFREISNTKITTVEISPTGSGKNRAYKDEPNTLMLMPSNSMVLQNNGLLSLKKVLEIDPNNVNKYRTEWGQIDRTKCDYMTYDKFYGHIIGAKEDISNMNIIIDEAHILFASDKEEYQNLVKALLNREIEYKELKLISATLRVETLALFTRHEFDINIYQKKDFTPHIHFVNEFPKVNPNERTLIFINSTDKMYQIEKYLKDKYNNIRIMSIKSGDKLPTKQEIEKQDVILSTSVIRQGYSIENKINKVIIHNVNNPEGAIGILQYMARPRNQNPEVYVVKASTHFNISKRPEGKDELLLREDVLEIIEKQKESNNVNRQEAIALAVESFAKKVVQSNHHDNPVLTSFLFEKEMKNIELYMTDGVFMQLSIKDFLPNATIHIIDNLKEKEDIKFDKLNIKEYTNELVKLRSVEDVKSKISEMIENIKNDTTIDNEEKKRLENKLTKISDVEPLRDFTINGTFYQYTYEIIVKQMIDEDILNACKHHSNNIELRIYDERKAIDTDSRPNLGDKFTVGSLGRKVARFRTILKTGKKKPSVDVFAMMYRFDKFDFEDRIITAKNSKKVSKIKVTSLYPIDNSWYFAPSVKLI